jgi:hypothetical protein
VPDICKACGEILDDKDIARCDWHQGRCPHQDAIGYNLLQRIKNLFKKKEPSKIDT